MNDVKQQPPKTFTIEQMRKAVSTVESFKDAERVFETTKAMNFIAIRADRLLTQWAELVTAQDRMGFDFYWHDPEDNQPTSVRSAMALAKPYVVSHGNTYKAAKARRDADEPKAEEYKSPFSNRVDFFNTLDDFSKGGEVKDKAKMTFFLKCGFVEKSGLFKKPEMTRKGRESLNRFLSYDAAMKSELEADEYEGDEDGESLKHFDIETGKFSNIPINDKSDNTPGGYEYQNLPTDPLVNAGPKHDFDHGFYDHPYYDDPCDPELETRSLFDSNDDIYDALLSIIETGGRSDPLKRQELKTYGLVRHNLFTGTKVTPKGMNWMGVHVSKE